MGPGKLKNRLGQIRQPASTVFENNAAVQFMGGNCVLSSNTFTSGWPCTGSPLQTATGPGSRRLGHNKPNLSSLIHCQWVNPTHWESVTTGNKGQTVFSSRCQCKTYHALFTARWHCGRKVCKWVCICECLCVYPRECKQARLFKQGMYSIRMEDLWMRVSYWSLLSWGLEADNTAFERKMRLYVLGLCAIFCRGKREMKKKKRDRFDKEDRNTLFATLCRRSYCYQHGAALSRQMRDRGQKKQLVGVMFVHQGWCFLWTASTIMKMKREIEIRDEESFINHSLEGRREQNW